MDWRKQSLEEIWKKEISHREEKEKVANIIAKRVKNNDVIGMGSGSTSYLAILEIAKKIKEEKLSILAIPTSLEIKMVCNILEIPTTTLLEHKPDWCFDGADEVNDKNWLIKGRGAAMFKEKLNIANSKENYILVDKSKMVERLRRKISSSSRMF